MRIRKTHKIGPLQIQPERAEPRDHGRKKQPDSANEVLPGKLHQSPTIPKMQRVRGSSKRRLLSQNQKITKNNSATKTLDIAPTASRRIQGSPPVATKLPSGTAQAGESPGSGPRTRRIFSAMASKRAAPNPDRPGRISFVAEKNAKRIDFQQSGRNGSRPGQEPLDVFMDWSRTELSANSASKRGHDPSQAECSDTQSPD